MGAPGLVLQHDRDAPPALLADWLDRRGIAWRAARLWRERVPALDGARFVVSLGSEHSAADSEPAWVPVEIELLRAAVRADVPVLGLCFGGQALAIALGGSVHPASPPEIGWDEVTSLDPATIPPGRWASFHYESFTVPPGAELLARTRGGPAAFRLGPHLGLQFHPEATRPIVNRWAELEQRRHPGIDARHLAAEGKRHGGGAARRASRLFEGWWEAASLGT